MSYNRSDILNVYQRVKKAGDLEKNPYELIKLVLNELSRTMNLICEDIEKKKMAASNKKNEELIVIQKAISKNVSRSLSTIYSLQVSLDFEKGGKIATSLFELYEFCRLQVIEGFSKSINTGIKKAKLALDQIITAWDNMTHKRKQNDDNC